MPESRRKVFRPDRLRLIREQRGLTQEELATRLGIKANQENRYENSKSEPLPDLITRMAVELDVTTDYLLGLSDIPNGNIGIEDLTDQEKLIINSYRAGDYESLMRRMLDRMKAKQQDKPPSTNPDQQADE